MGKILAAALIAVIAIDKIKFDNELYLPGEKVDGLTPEQAQGLVDNGHARPVEDAADPALEAGGDGAGAGTGTGEGQALVAPLVKAAVVQAAAAKTAAAKTTAKK